LAAACNQTRAPTVPGAREQREDAGGLWQPLPDRIAGFSAGPMTTANGALNRTYARAGTRVMVTLARFPMDADQYDHWVSTSVAGFPQARLDVPAGAGNGFYQCDDHAPASCSLLVQLRAGVHLEIRGAPASRDDVDVIARGLPLRLLALNGAGLDPRP
jgi:hypothetical protein